MGNKSYAGSYFYIAAEREQMRFYTEIVDLKITSFALSMKITCFLQYAARLPPSLRRNNLNNCKYLLNITYSP